MAGYEELEILDLERLFESTDGDAEFEGALLDAFIETTPPYFLEFDESLKQGNLNDARRAVHSVKGSSAALGLKRLCEVAGKIEEWVVAGATGTMPYPRATLDQLFSEGVKALLARR